jgi:serine protease Do
MVYRQTDAGLRVERIQPGTFGADAGLQAGDLLVRLGGTAVFTRSDVWAINGLVPPGTDVEVDYIREGERRSAIARLSPVTLRALGE